MSLRNRIQEFAREQAAAQLAQVENTEVTEDAVEVADAVEEVEQLDQEAGSAIEANEEADQVETEIDDEMAANTEKIEGDAEPTDAEVVATEMAFKHYAYRLGMVNSIATESIFVGGAVGELAFESYNYASMSNREKIRNVNLALESLKESLGNVKDSIVKTIKRWIEAIKNFFKTIFSGTYRAYKYVKANADALKKAIASADINTDDYKAFAEKYSKSSVKIATALGMVDKDKVKEVKAGSAEAMKYAAHVADFAIKNIETLKAEVVKLQSDKDEGRFKKFFAYIATLWKHDAPKVTEPSAKEVKPADIANSIDGLLAGYEKISGGVSTKIVSISSFICEKIQAGLGKVGSQESKDKNEANRKIFAATREFTKAISMSSTAINSALVAIAKYGKKLNIKPEEAKAAESEASKSE